MGRSNPAVLNINKGSVVWYEAQAYTISSLLDLRTVLAKKHDDGLSYRLQIDKLKPSKADGVVENAVSLIDIPQKSWDLAQHRFEVIKPLLEKQKHFRKKDDIVARAKEKGVGLSTIYRWLDLYESTGVLSALGRTKRADKGRSRINHKVDEIIEEVIHSLYLTEQRIKASAVVEEVSARCRSKGLKAPHANTIRNRINALPEALSVSKRHGRQAAKAYEEIKGSFPGAEWPLAYVQIDHTPVDIILVDDETRQPVGRPYITLALDVYSRMVTGFYLSFDPPSCFTVGMCIAHSVLPKQDYLAEFDVMSDWPVEGKMKVIHVDNALEFRSNVLQRACNQHQIDLQWRPVREPQYGGHVERVFRTISGRVHELPGTTFSSVEDKAYYDSEKYSAFTLKEFEGWLTTFIVDKYHQSLHSTINSTPISRYQTGILGDGKTLGVGLAPRVVDKESFRIDFMPYVKRTIQNYGMRNDKIYYYHDVLRAWINALDPNDQKRKRRFIFHYDPRDISKFYFWDPELSQYYVIPYRDKRHPRMSLWELRAANKKARDDGYATIDENILFDAHEKLKMITRDAVKKTRTERKKQLREGQRRRDHQRQMKRNKDTAPILSVVEKEDDFDELEILPFDDIRE